MVLEKHVQLFAEIIGNVGRNGKSRRLVIKNIDPELQLCMVYGHDDYCWRAPFALLECGHELKNLEHYKHTGIVPGQASSEYPAEELFFGDFVGARWGEG